MVDITTFGGRTTQVDGTLLAKDEVDRLLAQVGERVSHVRERKGIPRRVLSELSGVSPRDLAQLESGACNNSIGLLQRVAPALNHRIEWLEDEDGS
jgi:XRE family transcriptional regulator, aerobic/anaerobic benzoate catabolism transcriptional regulator